METVALPDKEPNESQERVKLSPGEWEAIKIASIKGVSDESISEKWGITREAIRQRRCRDEVWKQTFSAGYSAGSSQIVTEGAETALLAKKAASTIAESHQSLSLSNRLLASQIAQKALMRGSGAIDSLEVENFGDLEKIIKMAALAGGWSQPQVNVAQSFAFGGSDNSLECVSEIVQSEAITDEFH